MKNILTRFCRCKTKFKNSSAFLAGGFGVGGFFPGRRRGRCAVFEFCDLIAKQGGSFVFKAGSGIGHISLELQNEHSGIEGGGVFVNGGGL